MSSIKEFHLRSLGASLDLAPLDVSEANYLDISISGIMKLVHDYGMRAVFVDFYDKYSSSSNWDEAFEEAIWCFSVTIFGITGATY